MTFPKLSAGDKVRVLGVSSPWYLKVGTFVRWEREDALLRFTVDGREHERFVSGWTLELVPAVRVTMGQFFGLSPYPDYDAEAK